MSSSESETNPFDTQDEPGDVGESLSSRVRVRPRGVGGAEPSRTDHRSERTVEDILVATFKVLREMGASKLSVRAVCDAAGISRGTLYRYFASKEELIDAAARFLRDQTDKGVLGVAESHEDPHERFDAFLDYTLETRVTEGAARLLKVEPAFLIKYFHDNFDHFKARIDRALGPVYDSWDETCGQTLDRDFVTEMLVRYALSDVLVPSDRRDIHMKDRLYKLADQLLDTSVTSKAGKRK